MDGRLSALVSSNSDITYDRENAILLIEKFGKEAHPATREDIRWFWQDIEMECETDVAWDYVQPRVRELSGQYPFLITEWFMNWYRFMPDIIEKGIDRTGQIDWNLFFSLAYPLPGGLAVPFCVMIEKLNVAQLREVKVQIVDEVWKDPEMRKNIFKEEGIPSIYTYYMPYQTIRKRVIEKDKKTEREKIKERERSIGRTCYERRKVLIPIFQQVIDARKEGTEVVFNVSNKTTNS